MKISMWIPNTLPWPEVADLARLADAGPWHTVWYADHYMPDTGDETTADGDVHEAWSMLPALAVITERVRLGPLVSPTSIHHPALLANRAVTIDHISDGRFTLGLGAGWQINEHHGYGIPLEPPGRRVSRFEEAIQVVRSLLDRERTTFTGTYFRIDDAPCRPAPIQRPLPIVVGTGGERMMAITARWAQGWNTWGALESAARGRARFVAACEKVGTDPDTIACSVQALVFMSDDEAELAARRDTADLTRAIVGTPQQLGHELAAYADAGFDEFILLGVTLGRSAAERLESYERFATEVADAAS
jgi:alkanesulfonate monooxygenase SsuD/methylene tetrahydromethanopterin reductase-like flavin-dependent oxidoreductase (luciferase family)